MQVFIFLYIRSLIKRKFSGTSIRVFGAIVLLETVCLYNLFNGISTIKIMYDTIIGLIQNILGNISKLVISRK